MPFNDSKEGQTHSFEDGCGEPEHNQEPWKGKVFNIIGKLDNGSHPSSQLQGVDEAITGLISSLLDQAREGYEKELKIADDRWKQVEQHHRDKHESDTDTCVVDPSSERHRLRKKINNWEIDGAAHSQCRCSFPLMAICSAEETIDTSKIPF